MRNYLKEATITSIFRPVAPYSSYFFSLNKWPIDKAPKVSNSSYLVGFGFLFLFHLYGYSAIDKFTFFTYNFFTFNFQLISIFFAIVLFLTVKYQSLVFFLFFSGFLFLYFFFGTEAHTLKYYREMAVLTSKHQVINWEGFLFLLFFFGWVFKIAKKYSIESYTLQESFFYKTALPSLYLFELFTFAVLLAWRYLNSALIGYSSGMYLKFYRFQFILNTLVTKLIFFLFLYCFYFFLLTLLKQGSRLLFFFSYVFVFSVFTFFMFKEFYEMWAFLHLTAPSNLQKFTYFKFFFYLLFFNFLHVYLVAGFSLIGFFLFLSKFYSNYSDFYDVLYINIKNFYLIMWLTVLVFLSIYIIHELHVYLGSCVMYYF